MLFNGGVICMDITLCTSSPYRTQIDLNVSLVFLDCRYVSLLYLYQLKNHTACSFNSFCQLFDRKILSCALEKDLSPKGLQKKMVSDKVYRGC